MNSMDWLSLTLVVVGALNWGLVGIGMLLNVNLNLVELLLGWSSLLEAVVYLLVGLAGLYELYFAYQLRSAQTPDQRATAE